MRLLIGRYKESFSNFIDRERSGHNRVFCGFCNWSKDQAVGFNWPGLAVTAYSFTANAYFLVLSDMLVRVILKLNFL